MQLGFTLYISGFLLVFLGVSMFIPAGLDYFQAQYDFSLSFCVSALFTIFWGVLFILCFKNEFKKTTIPQMYLATTLSWILICLFSAIPFTFAPLPISYTDAFFEAMSGLSTMGATVYSDIFKYSKGIILWRSLLQWFGGLGIIALAMLLLPFLRIGGMQLFQMENSDKNSKQKPKVVQVIGIIALVYVTISILCILCLWATELNFFDALNFSLTTIPTGGFAPGNTSAINISGLAQCIITFFMFISGMPLLSLYFLYRGDFKDVASDIQIKTYTFMTLFFAVLLTVWILWHNPELEILEVFRTTLFNVTSTLSSTGFNASDLELGGSFAVVLFCFLTPAGACTGSTSGGIKVFRFNILMMSMMQSFRQKLMPHAVFIPKFNKTPVTNDVVLGVCMFMITFFMTAVISILLLTMCELDLLTSTSAVFSALGNTGIGVGPVVGTHGAGFGSLPDFAKWVLSVDMLLGRLEFMSVFILIMPMAWRRNSSRRANATTASF